MEGTKSEVDTVSLRPFVHQVGGHSNFQQFDKYTVCKPLFSKELKFYREMPSALKPFIPKFKGIYLVFSFSVLTTDWIFDTMYEIMNLEQTPSLNSHAYI